MEREPGIERDDVANTAADRDDDLAWIASLPPCPGIPCTEEEAAAAVARAREQVRNGRGVPGEEVARWVTALGTADERPMPSEWLP